SSDLGASVRLLPPPHAIRVRRARRDVLVTVAVEVGDAQLRCHLLAGRSGAAQGGGTEQPWRSRGIQRRLVPAIGRQHVGATVAVDIAVAEAVVELVEARLSRRADVVDRPGSGARSRATRVRDSMPISRSRWLSPSTSTNSGLSLQALVAIQFFRQWPGTLPGLRYQKAGRPGKPTHNMSTQPSPSTSSAAAVKQLL